MGLRQYPLSREDTLVWACLDYATDLEQRIPFDWYKIFREKGRPYLVAITILADLRFWYTPYVSRGTDGGTAYSKKFRGELLQRDYFQLERDYGITQDQAKRAMRWLESMGVARRVTEAVVGEGGMKGGTRMYMVYYADKVRELELEWRAEAAAEPMDDAATVDNSQESVDKSVDKHPKKPTVEKPTLGTDRGNFHGRNSAPTVEISTVTTIYTENNHQHGNDDDVKERGEEAEPDTIEPGDVVETVRRECLALGFSGETAVWDLVYMALENFRDDNPAMVILLWIRHAQGRKGLKNPPGLVWNRIRDGEAPPGLAFYRE